MRIRFVRRLLLILLISLSGPVWGQAPAPGPHPQPLSIRERGVRLLADLAPGSANSSSYPRRAVEVDGALYFVATHPLTGREVWRWDGGGTPARPLEACPGRCSSDPRILRPFGEKLVFVASGAGDAGRTALWITGGDRPRWLHDVGAWDDGSRLAVTSSSVYFTVRDKDGGSRLMSSDGTVGGTGPAAGTESWRGVRSLTGVGDRLFAVAEVAGGIELWTIADHGSSAFLMTVSDRSRPGWTEPFPQHDGTIWFNVAESRCALWSSDGTAGGTRLLTRTLQARGSEGCGGALASAVFLDDGVLIFMPWRTTSALVKNLWRSDGTDDGTFPLGWTHGDMDVAAAGDRAFFGVGGIDTNWISVTDGTALGTHASTNGDLQYDPGHPIAFQDGIVFTAYNQETGRAVWRTDGTLAGTRLVADVDPEIRPSLLERVGVFPELFSAPFAAFGGRLVFPAFERTHGEELWVTDGTAEGTVLAADVNPGVASSEPREITPVEGVAEETALLRAAGRIWRTTGDAVVPMTGIANPADQLFGLTPAGGKVFAENDAGELWSLAPQDGTARLVAGFDCPPTGGAELNGRLLFIALEDLNRHVLYASDGTVQVADLPELVQLSGPPALPLPDPCPPMPSVRLGGRLYVLAPHHLLTTDGTTCSLRKARSSTSSTRAMSS